MRNNRAVLLEEIKTLPESSVPKMLDFVGYLKHQEARKHTVTPEDAAEAEAALARGAPCPICARYYDPETEDPPFNAETLAAFEEGDAMERGEIPAKLYNSFEEMLVDLDADDEDD